MTEKISLFNYCRFTCITFKLCCAIPPEMNTFFFLSIICNLFWISKSIIFLWFILAPGLCMVLTNDLCKNEFCGLKKDLKRTSFLNVFLPRPIFIVSRLCPLTGDLYITLVLYRTVGLINIYNSILQYSSRKDTHTPQKKHTNKQIHNNNKQQTKTTTTITTKTKTDFNHKR